VCACVALGVAACLPLRKADDSSKLDRALREWILHPTAAARVMIQPRAGATLAVAQHLNRLAPGAIVSQANDLIVATLDARALRAVAADAIVRRVSADATVRSLGTVELAQNILLQTEGLIPRPYDGGEVGVAVIDSGILPNANEKVVATYDFTNGTSRKV